MDPTKEEFLAVVSEWSGYGHQSSSLVGNAYPLFSFTSGKVVDKPLEQFPNPGYIFLVNRGELTSWDFVRIKPGLNKKYKNAQHRECYFISMPAPPAFDDSTEDLAAGGLIHVPNFDPTSSPTVIRNPSQGVTPVFFVRNVQQRIYGPLCRTQVVRNRMDNLEAIHWEPYGPEGIVYELTFDDLLRLNINLVTYEHPEKELNQVVEQPFTLLTGPILDVTSAKAYDRISDEQLAEWYLRWKKLPEVPDDLLKVFRAAPDYLADTPEPIIRQRCRRLSTLFTQLDTLQTERRSAARNYLDTDEGKQLLDQQLQLEISRRAKSLEEEVKRRQLELSSEKENLDEELKKIEQRKDERERELNQELRHLEEQRDTLTTHLNELQTEMQKGVEGLATQVREQFPVLAALSTGIRAAVSQVNVVNQTPTGATPGAAPGSLWSDLRPVKPTKELANLEQESQLIDELEAELAASHLSFTRDFIANLYVCLKSCSLNLITGPPGHGKSSVVAALARALGHGNALLEIAVRRSWSDDRYLLGFFDTFHGRYDPGPTGLATRLLQAQRDWEQGGDGLYMIMLDEFNLAAPEYYFSQLLQVLPRAPLSAKSTRVGNEEENGEVPEEEPRRIRLFDPATMSVSGEVISEITLYPNVVFWGTINYDETTERLSPRLLDRTGMIFLTAGDVKGSLTAAEAQVRDDAKGAHARQLMRDFSKTSEECPDDLWERMDPLLELLRKQSDAFGSGLDLSPRVIDNIKRYLANSEGVLAPGRAVDFVFQQRVIPVLRGRGPKFSARIQALRERLAADGLHRSARHVSDALALAEINFGDIDFFEY